MIIRKIRLKIGFILGLLYYKAIYKKSFVFGEGSVFRKRFEVNIDVPNGHIIVGKSVFFNNDCSINCHGEIVIGDRCIFGEGVRIYDHNHIFRSLNTPISKQGYSVKSVRIGEGCWIGSNVCILSGADIGDHTIIGAGTIVSGVIPAHSIVTAQRELIVVEREDR